jgi:hypothetical protein
VWNDVVSDSGLVRLAILSDVHYAGPAERRRTNYCLNAIRNPIQRFAIQTYRHFVWLRDPLGHNHMLDRFLQRVGEVNWVIANGDYSCDSAFIGVTDAAACESARECLEKLRARFGDRFQATIGDHELGKKPLGADTGGLRLDSYRRVAADLALQPFWQLPLGRYVLMGVVSTLIALPVYELETLPDELAGWKKLREDHLEEVRSAFAALKRDQRVLLFCHDPTALPFLFQDEAIRSRLNQIERTVIGHLHSRVVLWKGRLLAGIPPVTFLGHTIRRLSTALRQAHTWKHFNLLLCPSLSGIQLLKDGGFYVAVIDPATRWPARFEFHPLPWS